MTVETAADRAAFVSSDDFGVAGVYTPAGGAAAAIALLLDAPHEDARLGGLGALQPAYRATVRADDVALPAEGDTLVAAGLTFKVRNARQDLTGDLWTLDLELQP